MIVNFISKSDLHLFFKNLKHQSMPEFFSTAHKFPVIHRR
ncbi:MAG: hypothetical protein OFPI_43010 [Osedax symbiont Rs2]|nr:MAG: hypothetical protein OFPI_43010 [Osedax symbiont Rs2]